MPRSKLFFNFLPPILIWVFTTRQRVWCASGRYCLLVESNVYLITLSFKSYTSILDPDHVVKEWTSSCTMFACPCRCDVDEIATDTEPLSMPVTTQDLNWTPKIATGSALRPVRNDNVRRSDSRRKSAVFVTIWPGWSSLLLPVEIVTTWRVSGQVSGMLKTLGNRLQD